MKKIKKIKLTLIGVASLSAVGGVTSAVAIPIAAKVQESAVGATSAPVLQNELASISSKTLVADTKNVTIEASELPVQKLGLSDIGRLIEAIGWWIYNNL